MSISSRARISAINMDFRVSHSTVISTFRAICPSHFRWFTFRSINFMKCTMFGRNFTEIWVQKFLVGFTLFRQLIGRLRLRGLFSGEISSWMGLIFMCKFPCANFHVQICMQELSLMNFVVMYFLPRIWCSVFPSMCAACIKPVNIRNE